VFKEFENTSYLKRYDILCQKLVREQLYTTASVIASPREAVDNGSYSQISDMTNIRSFVSSLAGHIAATAARLG
jgi:type II restriction enzyme